MRNNRKKDKKLGFPKGSSTFTLLLLSQLSSRYSFHSTYSYLRNNDQSSIIINKALCSSYNIFFTICNSKLNRFRKESFNFIKRTKIVIYVPALVKINEQQKLHNNIGVPWKCVFLGKIPRTWSFGFIIV